MQPLKIYDPSPEKQRIKDNNTLSAETRQLIEKQLKRAAQDGRVQCSGALAIARSLGVKGSDVGDVADELRIKISRCQLGCF